MLFKKTNQDGIFLEDVLLDSQPYLIDTVTEIIPQEDGTEEEIEVQRPVLDDEGNPIPDPTYVAEPIPEGMYAVPGLCPQWDGEQWVENVPRPEPTAQPHESTELEVLQQTVDSIFTEILPTIFGL